MLTILTTQTEDLDAAKQAIHHAMSQPHIKELTVRGSQMAREPKFTLLWLTPPRPDISYAVCDEEFVQ